MVSSGTAPSLAIQFKVPIYAPPCDDVGVCQSFKSDFLPSQGRPKSMEGIIWCSTFVFSTSLYVNSLIIQKMHLCCVHLSDVLLLEVNRSFHSIISKDCKAMEFMKRVGQCGLVLVLNVALV